MGMDFLFCKQLLPSPLEYDKNGLLTATQNPQVNYPTKNDATDYPYELTYFFRIDGLFTDNYQFVVDSYGQIAIRGAGLRRASDGVSILGIPNGLNSPYILNKTAHYVAQTFKINSDGTFTHGMYWNGWYGQATPIALSIGTRMRVYYTVPATGPSSVIYNRVLSKEELDHVTKVYAYKNPIGG